MNQDFSKNEPSQAWITESQGTRRGLIHVSSLLDEFKDGFMTGRCRKTNCVKTSANSHSVKSLLGKHGSGRESGLLEALIPIARIAAREAHADTPPGRVRIPKTDPHEPE